MRITLLAVGSRGDVDPFLALAVRLRRAGHRVRLSTHDEFARGVGAAGIEFATLPGNPRAVLASPEGQAMLTARNPSTVTRRMSEIVGPALDEALPAAVDASRDADLVVFATLAAIGPTVAEIVGAQAVAAHLQPQTPTRAFGPTGAPGAREAPALLRRPLWALTDRLLWKAFLPTLAAQRSARGLPELPAGPPSTWPVGRRPPTVYGYSPVVVPTPGDWPPDVHVTGYWTAPDDPTYEPPAALADFLAAGPPPVYVGFGSMPDRDSRGLAESALTAARRAGGRVVLLSGWSGLAAADHPDVIVVDDVSHRWLFPRVAAVVHHGGAGTTAAGLRAGRPTVVVPFFADQFFWGRRIAALGAGPAPIAREKLTTAALTDAVRDALRPPRTAAATGLGARLAAEDGTGAGVAVLERLGARG